MIGRELDERLNDVLAARAGRPSTRVVGPLVALTGGWAITSVYACSLSIAAASGDVVTDAVLKLYGADQDGVQHASREWQALRHLDGTDCAVPAVLDFEPDPTPLGCPFLLMQRLAGRSVWSAYEEARDADAGRAVVRAFVQPLVALHALDAVSLEPAAARAGAFDAVDRELDGLHRDVAVLRRSGLEGVVRWLQDRRTEVPCRRQVILHRDYHAWNALVDATGTVRVLDWDWRIGDPRFDVAWTCTLMQRSGHDAFSDAVRAEYTRQSGIPLERAEYFEVLTTLRWLANVLPALDAHSPLEEARRAEFRTFLIEPLHRAQQLLHQHTGLEVPLST